MKRIQIITAIIVAALTFFSLQAFVGHSYWRHYGDRWGYYRYHGYYPGCAYYYRDSVSFHQRNNTGVPQKDSVW